ncbi:MAG: hypothetical protein QF886_21205 [Planctomycetota bacterium]|jgi:hypothetical protein|nr:hypothetical protein [Planctomycetota bacterium]
MPGTRITCEHSEGELPVQPLWLDKGMRVPLDLESTYSEACERSRLS